MPTYQYQCTDCDREFEVVRSMREYDEGPPPCPHCGKRNVRAVLAPFFARTSRKS